MYEQEIHDLLKLAREQAKSEIGALEALIFPKELPVSAVKDGSLWVLSATSFLGRATKATVDATVLPPKVNGNPVSTSYGSTHISLINECLRELGLSGHDCELALRRMFPGIAVNCSVCPQFTVDYSFFTVYQGGRNAVELQDMLFDDVVARIKEDYSRLLNKKLIPRAFRFCQLAWPWIQWTQVEWGFVGRRDGEVLVLVQGDSVSVRDASEMLDVMSARQFTEDPMRFRETLDSWIRTSISISVAEKIDATPVIDGLIIESADGNSCAIYKTESAGAIEPLWRLGNDRLVPTSLFEKKIGPVVAQYRKDENAETRKHAEVASPRNGKRSDRSCQK